RVVSRLLRARRRRLRLARALRPGRGGRHGGRRRARRQPVSDATHGGRAAPRGGHAMIPLRDDVPSRTKPIVTMTLVGLNVVAFLYQLSLSLGGDLAGTGGAAEAFVMEFGAVPCRLTGACGAPDDFPSPLLTIFTAVFMHGGL